MKKVIVRNTVLFGALALFGTGISHAAPMAMDFSNWRVEQYDFPDEAARWNVSQGTAASQGVNADASILIGGVESSNRRIEGNFRVDASDNDYMGFVFGYQNRGQYYLFDWKKGDQIHETRGSAQQGMSVKVVNTRATGGGDPTASDLWVSSGTDNVTSIFRNSIAWESGVDYTFVLNFVAGEFVIEVSEGNRMLETIRLSDDTYGYGDFGFYNYSQAGVTYSGFTTDTATLAQLQASDASGTGSGGTGTGSGGTGPGSRLETAQRIPEPTTLLLMAAGLAGLGYQQRRRKS